MTDTPNQRRKLSYTAYTECWYVPGETHIVDLIHPDDGRTLHYQEDQPQVHARHPAAVRMTCDEAWKVIDETALERYRKDVSEITEARFMDALNVLPPVGWTTRHSVESFRISERLWGNITDIYARLGERFFTLTDDIRLSPAIVAERVAAFAAAHPQSLDSSGPERPEGDERDTGCKPPSPGNGDGA